MHKNWKETASQVVMVREIIALKTGFNHRTKNGDIINLGKVTCLNIRRKGIMIEETMQIEVEVKVAVAGRGGPAAATNWAVTLVA